MTLHTKVTSYQSLHPGHFIPSTSYQYTPYRSHFIPVTSSRSLHLGHFIPSTPFHSLWSKGNSDQPLHTEVTLYKSLYALNCTTNRIRTIKIISDLSLQYRLLGHKIIYFKIPSFCRESGIFRVQVKGYLILTSSKRIIFLFE